MTNGRSARAERRCTAQWVDAWVRAAEVLSGLSREHPSLTGLVIASFDTIVEGAGHPHQVEGGRLTIDEVRRLHAAAHSRNTRFGFYPKMSYAHFGANLAPGCVLGVNYGVQLFPDEDARVELDGAFPGNGA